MFQNILMANNRFVWNRMVCSVLGAFAKALVVSVYSAVSLHFHC